MKDSGPIFIKQALEEREKKGLIRSLSQPGSGVDFVSNDYLGFSRLGLINNEFSERFSDYNFRSGSGGSRLISGHSALKEDAEKLIANYHRAEAALLFNSGYDANLGLLSAIGNKNTLFLYDELAHASIHDGMRLSFAKSYKFKHNNLESLEKLIERHTGNFESVYIVVESVYSMDGDEAPLTEIVQLVQKHKNVFLIVDEAHAIGVFGEKGRGLCTEKGVEQNCFARIYTYGKAMGCHGAAVAGSKYLKDYLINFARSFIYTTALPDYSIAHIICAYYLLQNSPQQKHLSDNINNFLSSSQLLTDKIKSRSAIQCIVCGMEKAVYLENRLKQHNFLVKAVKSPTVKEGTERLRICLHAFNSKEEINALLNLVSE